MARERRDVVIGQFVSEDKRQFARQLRREMTPQEAKVWQAVRGRRLGGFKLRRQQVIDGFIADFYCAEVGLVVELDGAVHDDRVEYDANRDLVIAQRRLTVLRIRNERIDNELAAVLREVEDRCRRLTG
jgi:very-short-patch-repair endonuclease